MVDKIFETIRNWQLATGNWQRLESGKLPVANCQLLNLY